MYPQHIFDREVEKYMNEKQATEKQTTAVPRSMFDLEGEWFNLLEMSRQEMDPETGEYLIEEQIDAAFTALAGDIETKVAGCGFVLLRLKKEADMVKDEERRLQAKRKRVEGGYDRLEGRLREMMQLTKTDKVTKPQISVTLRKATKQVEVTVFEQLPKKYITHSPAPDPRPDKQALARDLKANVEVPGARLVDGKRSILVK